MTIIRVFNAQRKLSRGKLRLAKNSNVNQNLNMNLYILPFPLDTNMSTMYLVPYRKLYLYKVLITDKAELTPEVPAGEVELPFIRGPVQPHSSSLSFGKSGKELVLS
jgi:hypothetical protein